MINSERRIKRRIHGRPQAAVVRCPPGYADVAAEEIKEVFARLAHAQEAPPRAREFGGGVLVEGLDFRNLLQLTYELTVARDVLWRVHTAQAGNPSVLRRELTSLDWEDLLPRGARFGVRASSTRSRVYHEGLVEDEVASAAGRAGAVAVRKIDAEHMVEARLDRDTLEVFISLAGPRLYMRGFKSALRGVATIKEDLAAICVRLASRHAATTWNVAEPASALVLAPYAGTGTLGFEALIAAHRIPLWAFPRTFSQESLPCVPRASIGFIRKREAETARVDAAVELRMVEIDEDICKDLARDVASFEEAVERAIGLVPKIAVQPGDATEAVAALADDAVARDGGAMVLMNPPFGKRLGDRDKTRETYTGIAAALVKARGSGSRICGAVLAPDPDLAVECAAGMKGYVTKNREMRHGGLKVWVVAFATET